MIYNATLNRNGIPKIGIFRDPLAREIELKRELEVSGLLTRPCHR
jgi:hypothetical protein